jgi:hypothetical protein
MTNMPNQIDNTGLQIKTSTEIIAALTLALQSIYGADINLNSNSPDGQNINIFAQADIDTLELLLAVYNSFDIDSATGIILDERLALNGLTRQAGTYTVVPIDITVDRDLSLIGLNTDPTTAFVVADANGNQFMLIDDYTFDFSAAPTVTLNCQAVNIGLVETTLLTITNIVTVTLGVISVTNSLANITTGINEETDVALKIRHAKSFFLGALSCADAVEAALLELPSVVDALVYENATVNTVLTVPAHSIWCIVDGGVAADIANAIFVKKAAGCGMKGSQSVTVARTHSQSIAILYDVPITERLYVKFSTTAKNSGETFDGTAIKAALVAALIYKLNQKALSVDVVAALAVIEPDIIPTVVQVSTDNANWYEIVTPTTMQYKFTLAVGDITITTL